MRSEMKENITESEKKYNRTIRAVVLSLKVRVSTLLELDSNLIHPTSRLGR